MQEKDVNAKVIFDDPLLCSQFLRDNIDIPILKNVQPEDIEDVTANYQTFIGSEYRADSVKKVKLRIPTNMKQTDKTDDDALYLISLIDHKSGVDYDVSMQLLKYMVCIWTQYAKEMEAIKNGISKHKDFKYPPILPIVYYEGIGKWTAGLHLHERILMNQIFGEYIPDFTYRMVRIQDYSNTDLLAREDEMSFLMMINKIQTVEEYNNFLDAKSDVISRIFKRAPEHIIAIFADTVASLCRRLKATEVETEQCVEKVRKRQVGYLFENMEKMDIQAERKKTEDAQKKAEDAQKKAEDAQKKAEDAQKKAEDAQKKAENVQKNIENAKERIIKGCQQNGESKETAIRDLIEIFESLPEEAETKVNQYWKE